MDQPLPHSTESTESTEQAAARAIAAEESARQRAWRETARSSTTVIPKSVRRYRLMLPALAISSILLALICALLLYHMQSIETPGLTTLRHPTPMTRSLLPPKEPAPPIASAPWIPPAIPAAPPSAPTSADPPSPLVITINAPDRPVPRAEPPPPAVPLSDEERRQLLQYEQRMVAGTDLLSRDLAEREQTIVRTERRLTFEPERQPPLGAREELAEAIRYWEGAVGDERERLSATIHNRRAEVANLQRQLIHDQEVAASLRKRLENARQELDGVRKKLGPPP